MFVVGLFFLQCWARLLPAVLDPSVLSKRVEIGPTTTHFGLTCAQTMPRFAKLWSHTHGKQSCYEKVMTDRDNKDNTRNTRQNE